MKRSPIRMASALAVLLLAGSGTAVSAQTDNQDHEAHHPNGTPATEAAPAPQAGPGEGQRGHGMMGSGMGMNPEMMQMMQQMMGQRQGRMGRGMMGQRHGRMGPGMMGQRQGRMGMMGRGGMMRAMFAIMDADGDGTVSREEFQEAHDRIFNHMDADGDGQLTFEEMQAFMHSTAAPARQMPAHESMQMDEAAQAYMDAMQRMMDDMEGMEMVGHPGADFALMMIPHHQSAIDMAEAYLEHGDDPALINLANEIITAQKEEIEFLQNWLEEHR